jgi:hypothetical protein
MILLTTSSQRPLALYIFPAFLWAISKWIPDSTLHDSTSYTLAERPEAPWSEIRDNKNRIQIDGINGIDFFMREPRLESSIFREIFAKIGLSGLGFCTVAELYLSIIPPLSSEDKLPMEKIVQKVRDDILKAKQDADWSLSTSVYSSLLQNANRRARLDRFAYRAVAVTVKHIIQLREEPIGERISRKPQVWSVNKRVLLYPKMTPNRLHEFSDPYASDYHKLEIHTAILLLKEVYTNQGRLTAFETSFQRVLREPPPINNFDKKSKNWRDKKSFRFENHADVLGWTQKFYDSLNSEGLAEIMDDKENQWELREDISGRTLLAHAAARNVTLSADCDKALGFGGEESQSDPLYRRRYMRKGRDGQNPLHRALLHDMKKSETGEEISQEGRTAASTLLFFPGESYLLEVDWDGRTPLTLAAW